MQKPDSGLVLLVGATHDDLERAVGQGAVNRLDDGVR
jgi:hypothetical protein